MSYKQRLQDLEEILFGETITQSLKNDLFVENKLTNSLNDCKLESQSSTEIDPAAQDTLQDPPAIKSDSVKEPHIIDVKRLKKLVFCGLPEERNRPLVWRLLLNYLPGDTSKWTEILQRKRNLYYQHFITDFLINDKSQQSKSKPVSRSESGRLVLSPTDSSNSSLDFQDDDSNKNSADLESQNNEGTKENIMEHDDHPLNPNPDSKWQTFFRDNDVLLQIDKDVRRLCPEMNFFQSATQYPNEYILSGELDRLHQRIQHSALDYENVVRRGLGLNKITGKNNTCPTAPEKPGSRKNSSVTKATENQPQPVEFHWEVVERILFLFAKLNPGQSYVQGMNEIIGPIYYVLATDSDEEWRKHAEPDTFFLFTNLMGEVRDFFIRSLDNTTSGIKRMMEILMKRLNKRDPEVHNLLARLEIHPQYFSFRWITLLLSQEFPLPEVLRIWDSLLSDPNRFDFLIDLCCAMIIYERKELLKGDFPSNMKLLQNYPVHDVRDILTLASTFSSEA